MGLLFIVVGLSLMTHALPWSALTLPLFWGAFSFLLVGASYLLRTPAIFAKQSAGTTAAWSLWLLLPFRLLTHVIWHICRLLRKEASFQELGYNLVIGRRLLPTEMPPNIDWVLDLTCEFSEAPSIRRMGTYISFPILDGSHPTADEYHRLVSQIAALGGRGYIHCAEGHGRTSLVTIGILLERAIIQNIGEAIAVIRHARPHAQVNRKQILFLERILSDKL